MPIAMTPDGQITLLQMDGHMTREELKTALDMAMGGCRQVYEVQRTALIDKYNQMETEIIPDQEQPQEAECYEQRPLGDQKGLPVQHDAEGHQGRWQVL